MIPQELIKDEKVAFSVCESDKMFGLTWHEVKSCEERYSDLLVAHDIPVPSEDDFNQADENNDGVLMFEEWLHHMETQ